MRILVILYGHRIMFLPGHISNWSFRYLDCFLYWDDIRCFKCDAAPQLVGRFRWVAWCKLWNHFIKWIVRKREGYRPTIISFYVFVGGCIAGAFATCRFGGRLCCNDGIGRFGTLIKPFKFGVEWLFSAVNGYGKYLAGAIEGLAILKESWLRACWTLRCDSAAEERCIARKDGWERGKSGNSAHYQ